MDRSSAFFTSCAPPKNLTGAEPRAPMPYSQCGPNLWGSLKYSYSPRRHSCADAPDPAMASTPAANPMHAMLSLVFDMTNNSLCRTHTPDKDGSSPYLQATPRGGGPVTGAQRRRAGASVAAF